MTHGNRFFFVTCGTFLFALIFLLGITILPLICGLRYCCAKVKEPTAPIKPTEPVKPTKPSEPKVGATNEEWNIYRKTLAAYRVDKDKWKQDHKYYKENQSRLILAYEKDCRQHKKQLNAYNDKVLSPVRGMMCRNCVNTTTHIIFCREERPAIVAGLLRQYFEQQEGSGRLL